MNEINAKEIEPRYERFSSDMLHAELSFQTTCNPKIVNNIVENFDKTLLQPLDVSYRDDLYNVVDGKHRLYAIRRIEEKYGIKISIPCWVHFGLTEEDECKLFNSITTGRRSVEKMELYRSAYNGKDEFTVNIVNTIRNAGFIFDFEKTAKNGRIHLTKTIEDVFIRLGQKDFEIFLDLLYKTWNGDKNFLTQKFLKGFLLFYENYKDDIDPDLFVKRLKLLTKAELDTYIRNHNGDEISNIAVRIFQRYNKNKRVYSNNILEPKSIFFMSKRD